MSDEIAIVGIAETPPARRSPRDLKGLVLDAILGALDDAGIAPEEVDGIVTDAGIMPATVPADYIAGQLGIRSAYTASISYGGAGIVCSPMLAEAALQSGRANVVLSYFGVDWGSRPEGPYAFHDRYPAKLLFEKPYGYNAQPLYFAHLAQRYMHEYGLTEEDLARVAMTHRSHALAKRNAQMKKPLSLADYQASRVIATPLRVLDCCLVSDGAGAFVMTRADRAKDLRHRPVYVKGVGFAAAPSTGDSAFTQNPRYLHTPGAREASFSAQKMAGVSLAELDFAQIYDCFTISCLMEMEDIGICRRGEAGAFFRDGHATIGGRLPINTHGGLLSYSYLLGIEHVIEAVRQLRGTAEATQVPGAELGLVSGYSIPDYGVLILGSTATRETRRG